jgi:peptidoglycan/LPS O-acetylase OafA/YrhL
MQFCWGIFIAELQQSESTKSFISRRWRLCRLLSLILIPLGLYIASLPERHWDWMPWSDRLYNLLSLALMAKFDVPRFATGFGFDLAIMGLQLTPWLRDLFLSNRIAGWLGRQSFAVYLIHGTLLRTLLVYLVYGTRLPADRLGSSGHMVPGHPLRYPGGSHLLYSLAVWFPILYLLAALWTAYIDPWCSKMTDKFIKLITLEDSDRNRDLVLA